MGVWRGPDRITVYDASQGIFGVRKKLAKAFGLQPENVGVITKFVGGGCGCKGSVWAHGVLSALGDRQVGRPVKLVLTRQQMFGMVGGRPRIRQPLRAAATQGGRLTALSHQSPSTTSQFDIFLEAAASVSRHMYASAALETRHRLVRPAIGTPPDMRAPGEPGGRAALE